MSIACGVISYGEPVLQLTFNGNLNDTGMAGITGIVKGDNAIYSSLVPPNSVIRSLAFNTTFDTDQSAKVVVPTNSMLTFSSGFTIDFLAESRPKWLG